MYQKQSIVFGLIYGPTVFFTKLSLFLLYLKIFFPSQRIKYFIWGGLAVSFLVYTATTIAFAVFGMPKPGQKWVEVIARPNFHKESNTHGLVFGSFNVVSDFYLLILPMPILWHLKMPLRRKLGVITIFMTGLL